MAKMITIIPNSFGNDKDRLSVTICDLMTGKNKFTFSCHLSSVLDIINSNINSFYEG